jgi:hypothetical protein
MPLPLLLSLIFLITARATGDKNEIHLGGDACGRGTLNGPETRKGYSDNILSYSTYACGGAHCADSGSKETDMLVYFQPDHKVDWYSCRPM